MWFPQSLHGWYGVVSGLLSLVNFQHRAQHFLLAGMPGAKVLLSPTTVFLVTGFA